MLGGPCPGAPREALDGAEELGDLHVEGAVLQVLQHRLVLRLHLLLDRFEFVDALE